MTDSVDEVIPRNPDNSALNLLTNFSKGIDEIVNFGSHILKWDLEIANGNDEHIPILFSFRHFLELIDAISILVKHSSIDPCKLILRSALEIYFGLEYLFQKDTDDRCMAFLVWHTHKNLKTYNKLDPNAEQGKQLQNSLKNDKSIRGLDIPNIPELSSAIKNLESLLQEPNYQKAEQEYQRLKAEGEKNPEWYRLSNGPRNIQGLSEHLELSGLYEVLYRNWSGPTHGNDIIQGKLSGTVDNEIEIVQIRYPKDAQSVTAYAIILSLKTFSTYIENRIPSREKDFVDWKESMKEFISRVTSSEQLLKVVKKK